MKRNHYTKKHSRVALGSIGAVSLIITSLIAVMAYWSVDARCSAVSKEIGAAERKLRRLDSELTREKVKWDALKTPERLEGALVRFGLEMDIPRESQLVRMTPSGVPEHGQASLARRRAIARNDGGKTTAPIASIETPAHGGRSGGVRNARRR